MYESERPSGRAARLHGPLTSSKLSMSGTGGGVYVGILLDVILPVFLIGGCGYAIGRVVVSDVTLLIKLVFYVLGPALIFRSIYTSELSWGHAAAIFGFVVLLQAILFATSRLLGRWRGWGGDTQASASLVLTFANCGNYGLPVLLFAFGDQGFAFGIVFVLASVMVQSTLGIGVAAWHKGTTWTRTIGHVVRVPYLYAFIAAVLLRETAIGVPGSLYRSIDLLADAAIPAQLLMLGVQLSRVRLRHFGVDPLLLSVLKLVVPPLLGWGLTAMMGIDGMLRAVLIVEAGMPSAVNALILATNFRRDVPLAATTVLLSTVLSLMTVTVLLLILR